MYNSNIYANLPTTNLCEEKVRIQNNLLKDHVESLECDIKKLYSNLTELKSLQYDLIKNVSELCTTVKVETEHKDRTINELRAELGQCASQRSFNRPTRHCRDYSPPWRRPQNEFIKQNRENYHRLNDQSFCLNKSEHSITFKETQKKRWFSDRSDGSHKNDSSEESNKMFVNQHKFERRRSLYREDFEREKIHNVDYSGPKKDPMEHNQKKEPKPIGEPNLVEEKVKKKPISIQDYQNKMARQLNEDTVQVQYDILQKPISGHKLDETKMKKVLHETKNVDTKDNNQSKKDIIAPKVKPVDIDEKSKLNDKQNVKEQKILENKIDNSRQIETENNNSETMDEVAKMEAKVVIKVVDTTNERSVEKRKRKSSESKTKQKKAKIEKTREVDKKIKKLDEKEIDHLSSLNEEKQPDSIEQKIINTSNHADRRSLEKAEKNKIKTTEKSGLKTQEMKTKNKQLVVQLDVAQSKEIILKQTIDKHPMEKDEINNKNKQLVELNLTQSKDINSKENIVKKPMEKDEIKPKNKQLVELNLAQSNEVNSKEKIVKKPMEKYNSVGFSIQNPNRTDVEEVTKTDDNCKRNVANLKINKFGGSNSNKVFKEINLFEITTKDKTKSEHVGTLKKENKKQQKQKTDKINKSSEKVSTRLLRSKSKNTATKNEDSEQINKDSINSTMCLTHNGDIPVLHLSENEHLDNSILTEMLKEDLNLSNLSNDDISSSIVGIGEKPNLHRNINCSPPTARKRRRVIMTIDD